MEFRNRTRENFDWDTEDDLNGLLDPDCEIQTGLATDFPGVIREEDTPVPIAAVETELFDPNTIAAAAAANSNIKHNTGVYYDRDSNIPILKTNPTQPIPEVELDPTPEAKPNEEDDEDYDDDNDEVEEVEPP